ncbi:MAG: bifunctional metallophosphatase/5'-nucleotidase, partial [Clostridium sp.]
MKNFKIYFTSDMHGFVYPTDYTNNEPKALGMLNIINSFTKDENTLIIDGGDTIQGSPFTTYISKQNFDVHPISKVLNKGQYDFITLGNHDFNYGYDYLSKYLNNLDAKCICTNVEDKTGKLPIEPYSIKTLGNGLKVGIIGFSTDFINIWEQPHNLTNFNINDTLSSIKTTYDLVKPQVDILIGVYHGGFEKDLVSHKSLSSTKENQAYKICEEFDFDILLTGHQHMPISGEDLHGTYIAQTPHNGSKYIELNLTFDDKIVDIKSSLISPKVNPNEDIQKELMEYEKKVQQWLDTPVGFLDIPLTPSTHLDMALNGSYLANFINTIQLEVSGANVACTSFANSIKGFNKDVTVRDIVSTYIYPNTLVVLEITGKVLKDALLRSSEYLHFDGNEISISDSFLKPKVEHYNYDYYSNIDYGFALNKDGKNTLSHLKFNNVDVVDSDILTLVMNSYRSSGAGGYEFFTDCTIVREIQIEMTE